jgi:glycosyltransferase involved in cell wall biosynthesis
MRIHALCLVKNEADILRQSLLAARAWCDAIYVLDNGSTDGTWELVQDLARDDPAIVPWKQEAAPFHDNLRAQIYHAFADRAQPRDWWVRLDADEFYIDDPRQFLRRVPASTGCVWFAVVSYYFSTEEARRYHADPSRFADEVSITEKCRHYFTHGVKFASFDMKQWSLGTTRRTGLRKCSRAASVHIRSVSVTVTSRIDRPRKLSAELRRGRLPR